MTDDQSTRPLNPSPPARKAAPPAVTQDPRLLQARGDPSPPTDLKEREVKPPGKHEGKPMLDAFSSAEKIIASPELARN